MQLSHCSSLIYDVEDGTGLPAMLNVHRLSVKLIIWTSVSFRLDPMMGPCAPSLDHDKVYAEVSPPYLPNLTSLVSGHYFWSHLTLEFFSMDTIRAQHR